MRAKKQYEDRYPGLVPFDKGQSTIFFGRDQEKKELFYQICLEKKVVLFGKSGLGKSSLLNAGVSPFLESNGYLPIRVRFTSATQTSAEEGSENLLIRDFILAFSGFHYKKNIVFDKNKPQLWEYVKATDFNDLIHEERNAELKAYIEKKMTEVNDSKINIPVVPVFIFDQFEEFFLHPIMHQQEFLKQFAEIVHEETPYRILDWITQKEPEDRTAAEVNWHQQPNIKVVFALRSDKLANMQSLVAYIPTILRNRFELKALTPLKAAQAIKGPAEKKELGLNYTPPFSFEQTTLDEIVNELRGETNEIESSQLQIVCNFIEDRVRNKLKTTTANASIIVDNSIINPAQDFPLILDNFYETQLAKIEEPANRDKARKLIEDELVIANQRDSISKKKMNKTHGIGDNLIEEILNTRLVREENTSRGPIYELSHDTLIGPVVKSKVKREELDEVKKIEEERIALAELAKKKDKELEEKYKQLATEIKLREEAQNQKEELLRLGKKLKTRGLWVFCLTTFFLISILIGSNWYREYKFDKRERKLKNVKLKTDSLLDNYNKANLVKVTEMTYTTDSSTDSPKKNENNKAEILKIISSADSISLLTNNQQTNANINSLVDSIYKDDFRKKKINIKGLTSTEKIEKLKKIVPGYEAIRYKSYYNEKNTMETKK